MSGSISINWVPEPQLLKRLMDLAEKQGRSLDAVLTEAIVAYLATQNAHASGLCEADPLIGLFSGSPNLATESEEILQQEITPSGWTWK